VSSGIALLLQSIDTYEDRKIQNIYFTDFEKRLWNKIVRIHNNCAKSGLIKDRMIVDETADDLTIIFTEPTPVIDKGEQIAAIKEEMNAGLKSRKQALKELNPNMNDDEILKVIQEIDEDSTIEQPINDSEKDDLNGVQAEV
jgi:hypothetical protein